MRRARLFVLAFVLILSPTAAQAASWWEWLEELSGPGPFTGVVGSVPVVCQRGATWTHCWDKTKGDINTSVVVRFGWFDSGDHPRFKDLPATDAENTGKVRVVPISGLFLFRPHRAVDIGPGAGVMVFYGPGFDTFPRFVLTPVSASLRPLLIWTDAKWARVLRLELDTSYVTKGFTGRDFGNTRTAFRSGREFLTRTGIVIDLGDLFFF